MPLLDSLQGGGSYPTARAGEGRSLLDLLTSLGADPNQPVVPQTVSNPYAMGTQQPMANLQFQQGTGAPMGFGGSVPPAMNATAPVNPPQPIAAPVPAPRPAPASPLFTPPTGGLTPASAPTGNQDLGPSVYVPDGDTSGTAGTPDQAGGLIGALIPAAQQAAASPEQSKGLLGALGDSISSIGSKLTNLNPNQSQALISAGLTMLAGNDGSRSTTQLLGIGGIAGLNNYNANVQQQAASALAQRKAAQEAQHQNFEDQLAQAKAAWEINKPITVGQDQTLLSPVRTNPADVFPSTYKTQYQNAPGVARTTEVQGQDGKTYTVQLDRNGSIVGQPLLKSDPNLGPLSEPLQKNINDAQSAAATASQTYQSTARLANTLAQAPDFSSGFGASINDTLSKVTGNKDAGQQLRGQLAQFANSSILSELPPGSASDKDIQLVRTGVPSDTASKATWQSYLAAVGRVQQAAATVAAAKADYLTANRGSLAPLANGGTVNGLQFPSGTTFTQALTGQGASQSQQQGQTQQAGSLNRQLFGQLPAQQRQIVTAALASGNPEAIAKLRAKGYIQ